MKKPPTPNVFVTSDEAIIDVREVASAALDKKHEDGGRLTVMLKRGIAVHLDGPHAVALFGELRKRCEELGASFASPPPLVTVEPDRK